MISILRLLRTLAAESLAVGAIVFLFATAGDKVSPPEESGASRTATTVTASHERGELERVVDWGRRLATPRDERASGGEVAEGVRRRLSGAASTAGTTLQRELDRVLAPFTQARRKEDDEMR